MFRENYEPRPLVNIYLTVETFILKMLQINPVFLQTDLYGRVTHHRSFVAGSKAGDSSTRFICTVHVTDHRSRVAGREDKPQHLIEGKFKSLQQIP